MAYVPPVSEQRFVLETIADIFGLARLAPYEAVSPDLVDAILDESAKLASGAFAPLNRVGDLEGARWSPEGVTLPTGFAEAYRQYADGGWSGLGGDPEYGGQGLPFVLACAVQEQITSANMAFSLCMMLTQGAIEALTAHGSEALKRTYLTRLISGEWTGTMNLTEPQAGSDVGALRTRAERAPDGSYRIKGSKIFITWGDHDIAGNIVHLVLARLPDAPAGTKGISLFLVPKYLVKDDGSLGERNDARCVSIEHKLGIHASPTCTMSFGDHDACVGYLVGEENAGMRAMFTMMNHARVNVGLEGVAIAEAAYQHALAYAQERVQSAKFGGAREPVRIIEHADVRRMLLTMKSTTEAVRALAYLNAAAVDRAHADPDPEARRAAQGLADLLTPVTKAYATDMGVEVASLGVQVFGGMGFIEETGAAQHYRDARIAPIYEGTNGIQALDLVGRKLGLDGGAHWRALFAEIRSFRDGLPSSGGLCSIGAWLEKGLDALEKATLWLVGEQPSTPDDVAAGATPYLRMFGITVGAYLLARQAKAAAKLLGEGEGDARFLSAKLTTARFFAEQLLPQAVALAEPVTRGAALLRGLDEGRGI